MWTDTEIHLSNNPGKQIYLMKYCKSGNFWRNLLKNQLLILSPPLLPASKNKYVEVISDLQLLKVGTRQCCARWPAFGSCYQAERVKVICSTCWVSRVCGFESVTTGLDHWTGAESKQIQIRSVGTTFSDSTRWANRLTRLCQVSEYGSNSPLSSSDGRF